MVTLEVHGGLSLKFWDKSRKMSRDTLAQTRSLHRLQSVSLGWMNQEKKQPDRFAKVFFFLCVEVFLFLWAFAKADTDGSWADFQLSVNGFFRGTICATIGGGSGSNLKRLGVHWHPRGQVAKIILHAVHILRLQQELSPSYLLVLFSIGAAS